MCSYALYECVCIYVVVVVCHLVLVHDRLLANIFLYCILFRSIFIIKHSYSALTQLFVRNYIWPVKILLRVSP